MLNVLRIGLGRARFETRTYFRRRDQVFFTFLFPVMMLAIFATAFSTMDFGVDITAGRYYLPGMIAAGILLSGVQNLGVDIATEKTDGTLKRLAGTPLPALSYFLGKIGQVLLSGILQAGLILLVARLAFGVPLPEDADHWQTFCWVLLLGLITSALLGIALSALPSSGRSAQAVIAPIVLVLQFASGVYLPFSNLPSWLQDIASLFPLKWMAQGMREALLPDSYSSLEIGGSWNLPGVAAALTLWLAVGFAIALLTFRWNRED